MRLPNFILDLNRVRKQKPVLTSIMGVIAVLMFLVWVYAPFAGQGRTFQRFETRVGPIVPPNPALQSGLSAMQTRILAMEQENERAQLALADAQRLLAKQEKENAAKAEAGRKTQEAAQRLMDARIEAAIKAASNGAHQQVSSGPPVVIPPPARPLRQILPASKPKLDTVNVGTLPAGSVADGLLLHGVFSSVNQRGVGIPATFKVTGNFKTPQGRTVKLRDCRVTGNAMGETAASRLQVELKAISCVLPGGKAWTAPMRGYVSGRDNVLGIPGHLETRDSEKLQRLLLAALVAIPGQLADSTNNQLTALGPLGAVTRGGSNAVEDVSREAARLFIDEARQFVSVLWVRPNQKAYLYLLESIQIPDWVVAVTTRTIATRAID